MNIQAHFTAIQAILAQEFAAARQSILVAVAWLTDPGLLEVLSQAALRGCRVQMALLDDGGNRQAMADFERLQAAGGRVCWIPKANGSAGLLHHKFYVLDGETVIFGLCYWIRLARRAHENSIVVVRGDAALAQGYQNAFGQLVEKYAIWPMPSVLDHDLERAELQLELRTLEAQIVALSNEQTELERTIQQFARQRHQELGEILKEYLRLRREYWRQTNGGTEEQAAQAEIEHADYQKALEAFEQMPRPPALDAGQQGELKRLYGEVSMHCHPDRVMEDDRAAAQALFAQAREAYQQNDLDGLRLLCRRLEKEGAFADPAAVLTEQEPLSHRIDHLRLEIEQQLAAIHSLRESKTYQMLASLRDWDAYFASARQQLEEGCECLRQMLVEAARSA